MCKNSENNYKCIVLSANIWFVYKWDRKLMRKINIKNEILLVRMRKNSYISLKFRIKEKLMRYSIKYGMLLMAILIVFSNCGGLKNKKVEMSADTVTLSTVNVLDTTSYKLGNQSQCSVTAEATITFPLEYKDKKTTLALQRLFSDVVLEVPSDSMKISDAFAKFVKNVLNQYGEEVDEIEFEKDDRMIVYKYNSMTDIKAVYNKNGIISFCKEEVTKKNDKTTMTTHTYYNISLNNMSRIELNNVFADDVVSDISDLLKRKLLLQLKAKDEGDLMDMGYFNLDNLLANNNFFVGDRGLTWTFATYEIACYSVGETVITLDYETLKPYMLENSEVIKLIQ